MAAVFQQAEKAVGTVQGSRMPAVTDEAQTVLPFFDGQRLRLARENLGVTQRSLADAMAGRVTPAALSQVEKGGVKPRPGNPAELACRTRLPGRFFARDPAV